MNYLIIIALLIILFGFSDSFYSDMEQEIRFEYPIFMQIFTFVISPLALLFLIGRNIYNFTTNPKNYNIQAK